MYNVEITEEAKDDIEQLDGSQQIQIRKSLLKLENSGMDVGQPLHGPLAGYKKLKHSRLGLRVIFGYAQGTIEIIEVVAVGKREDKKVYDVATARVQKRRKSI